MTRAARFQISFLNFCPVKNSRMRALSQIERQQNKHISCQGKGHISGSQATEWEHPPPWSPLSPLCCIMHHGCGLISHRSQMSPLLIFPSYPCDLLFPLEEVQENGSINRDILKDYRTPRATCNNSVLHCQCDAEINFIRPLSLQQFGLYIGKKRSSILLFSQIM